MSRLGISIATFDDDDNASSPPISSPMGPYYSEELRMAAQPFKRGPFLRVTKTIDIIDILNSGTIVKNIGRGARSHGQLIRLPDGQLYILRKTLISNKKVRDDLINEQLIYTILEADPHYINYISNLLYADIPLVLHKSEAYNYAYFVFAYQDGDTLDAYIDSNKDKLSFEEVMPLITGIANALEFISSKGIVHRDIKPENIFITERDNKPLIFDFDISCRVGIDCNAAEFVGTRKYMTNSAKAILNVGNRFSAASYEYTRFYDLYSVAVLIEEDLVKIVKPADKDRLVGYARILKDQFKMLGGSRMRNKTRKNRGGGNCRIGIMNPTFGGKRKPAKPQNTIESLSNLSEIIGGGPSECPCSTATLAAKPMMSLPPGVTLGPITANLMKGGANTGCGCQAAPKLPTALGGYRATVKNLKYLKKWKQGKSIGFTMRSSLKAKGLIPRANGTKKVSPKYRK
jgi:serine/threonine protein kinase